MKNWKAPFIILLLLITAYGFRWDINSTKIESSGMTRMKIDRWNGSAWMERSNSSWHDQEIISSPWDSFPDSDSLTIIWKSSLGISAIWLLYAVVKRKTGERV